MASANRDTSLAWLTARLSRAKDIPALDKLLVNAVPRKQSIAEQRDALQRISEHFGIPLKKAKPRKKGMHGR